MKISTLLNQELKSSALWTTGLTVLFLLLYGLVNAISDTAIALPFFVLFYYLFFAIGRLEVNRIFRTWIDKNSMKVILLQVIAYIVNVQCGPLTAE